MVPILLRHISASWARSDLTLASLPAALWLGVCWHLLQTGCEESLLALMSAQAAQWALGSRLAATSCLAGLTARSPCYRCRLRVCRNQSVCWGLRSHADALRSKDMSEKNE